MKKKNMKMIGKRAKRIRGFSISLKAKPADKVITKAKKNDKK
jgi:hypothetical protein